MPTVTLTRAIDSSTLVFASIQEAVDAADSGDSLLIGTGTYREQVLIDSKDLTITAEDGATLESPDNGAITSSGGYNSVLTIKNATVDVANLDIAGRHQGDGLDSQTFAGVTFSDADGSFTDGAISGFTDSSFSGTQHGYGVLLRSSSDAHTVEIANNTISDFQENGIDARGTGLIADVHDNQITGQGSTALIAQNGVLVLGATGTIDHNTISDVGYTGASSATGVLLYGAASNAVVTGNTIDLAGAGAVGVHLYNTDAGTITGNSLSNADIGIWQAGAFTVPVSDANSNSFSGIPTNLSFKPDAGSTTSYVVAGTDGTDALDGAAGNDSLAGGDGTDTAYFTGNRADYTVSGTLT